jgi:arylsulfatase A-like enzyme
MTKKARQTPPGRQAHEQWAKPWYDLWPRQKTQTNSDRAKWADQRRRAAEARADDPRPNILFVFTDQQTYRALSCAGNRWCHTPNMDAIADRGVRFANAYCTDPICSPARSSMITSRMPHETGVVFNDLPVEASIPNMGHVFRNAGYVTAWSGKWHLPQSYVQEPDGIPGFDNLPAPRDQMRNLHGLGDQVDFLFTIDAEYMLRWELGKIGLPWLYSISLHNPHDICHWTSMPVRQHRNVEHYPPVPDNFETPEGESGFLGMLRDKGDGNQEIARTLDWDQSQWRAYVAAYYHMTQQVDRCIGLILESLDAGGWTDNTLVIFTSDHGDGCASHRWVAKNAFYEESMRVPLILSFPGRIQQGAVDRDHLASGLDLLPTMCDYADLPGPDTMRGNSLRTVLEDPSAPGREFVVGELTHGKRDAPRHGRMIRGRRYKLNVYSTGDPAEELFDLQEDPGELRSLANDPALVSVKEDLRAKLRAWMEETADPVALDG